MKVKTVRCDVNGCDQVADTPPPSHLDLLPPGWGLVEIFVADSGDPIQIADLCPSHAAETKGGLAQKTRLRRKIV